MGNKNSKTGGDVYGSSAYRGMFRIPDSPSVTRLQKAEQAFDCKVLEDETGTMPHSVTLKIGPQHLRILKLRSREIVRDYPYPEILSWSLNSGKKAFGITVQGKKKIVFEHPDAGRVKEAVEEFVDEIIMEMNRHKGTEYLDKKLESAAKKEVRPRSNTFDTGTQGHKGAVGRHPGVH